MLTNEEQRMLKTVAAFNDITEEQAKAAIVKLFLGDMLHDLDNTPLVNMKLPELPKEKKEAEIKEPKKSGGRPRKTKTLSEFVQDTANEVEQAEREGKMTKDEFVNYFSKKG